MKYWLLTTEYPPSFGGGIGTYCHHWSTILRQNGVAITVFIPGRNENSYKESIVDGIRVVEFSPYLKNASDFLGYETMISGSFAEIVRLYVEKEGAPDWVEAQEYNGIAYYLLQKKHLGISPFESLKVIITGHCPSFITFEHNHISTYQFPYFWIGEMERFCMKAADLCIFPSKYLSIEISKRFPSLLKNYAILHNPYIGPPPSIAKGNSEIDFLVIGKLSPAKGILRTINIFDKLWQTGHHYKLKLVGDENYFFHAAGTTMGDYIRKKYPEQIRSGLLTMGGTMPPEKLKEEIARARVVLVPSTVENLPYTVIESMASGALVLASAQGGQGEIIKDGENGFLFDYNDEISFEKKIHETYKLDKHKIEAIAALATQTIRTECDPQNYFTRKMELLRDHPVQSSDGFPFVYTPQNPKTFDSGKSENGLLSIVVPYFNMGKYISETIASIDSSSYPHREIIIVNDGSTDEYSRSILSSFASRKDIRIIEQFNAGLPAARNQGAKEAKGTYLAFLDADDIVAKEYYNTAIGALSKHPNVHFVGCWVQYFEGSRNKWPAFTPEPPLLFFHNMVNSSSLVYKKESFMLSGLNDSNFIYGMEDYDSVINMVQDGFRGVVIPEFLFFYRVRKDSMARGFNKSNQLYLYQLLAEKHKEFYATFAAEVFGLLNANGPGFLKDNPSSDYHLADRLPFGGGASRKLIQLVKKNNLTRKLAYRIFRLFNR